MTCEECKATFDAVPQFHPYQYCTLVKAGLDVHFREQIDSPNA